MSPPENGLATTAIYLELGAKRIFACAYDWPGWCRSGKDERVVHLSSRRCRSAVFSRGG